MGIAAYYGHTVTYIGFLSLGLPDTRKLKLLQTIEESETFYESEQTMLGKFIAKFRTYGQNK